MAESNSSLFEDATIISWDEATQQLKALPKHSLLTKADRIAAIFPSDQTPSLPGNVERISCTGKIITPGFINTHMHLWQTPFKTLGPDTTLAEYFGWFSEFASFTGGSFAPADVFFGQLAGIYESLNAGVTGIVDHAHHTWDKETTRAGLEACVRSGGRVWWCDTIHALEGGWTIKEQIEYYKELVKEQIEKGSATEIGLSYDGFGIGAEEDVKAVIATTKEYKPTFTTHHLGGPWKIDNGPQTLHDLGLLTVKTPIVISHAAFFRDLDKEIDLLRQHNQHISITPESEMHYGHDNPTSHLYHDVCGIGIDTHFTFSADMVTQARLWLQATRREMFRPVLERGQIPRNNPMSVHDAFVLATKKGADSVHRSDLGRLVGGAKADIVVFDGDTPGMLGWQDPVATVILHSNVGDIRHVLVDGKFRKRDGKLLDTLNNGGQKALTYEEVKKEFLKSSDKVKGIWNAKEKPVLEGKFIGMTPYGDTEVLNLVRKT